jgi:hypothetical protein
MNSCIEKLIKRKPDVIDSTVLVLPARSWQGIETRSEQSDMPYVPVCAPSREGEEESGGGQF